MQIIIVAIFEALEGAGNVEVFVLPYFFKFLLQLLSTFIVLYFSNFFIAFCFFN